MIDSINSVLTNVVAMYPYLYILALSDMKTLILGSRVLHDLIT